MVSQQNDSKQHRSSCLPIRELHKNAQNCTRLHKRKPNWFRFAGHLPFLPQFVSHRVPTGERLQTSTKMHNAPRHFRLHSRASVIPWFATLEVSPCN